MNIFKRQKIKQKEKLDIISKVYWNNSISDSIYKSLNETNDWNSIKSHYYIQYFIFNLLY